MDDLAARVATLLEDYREDLPEALWALGLGMIERGVTARRQWAWWRAYPTQELARLEEAIDDGLRTARLAAELQAVANKHEADLARATHEEAARAARAARGRKR
jgi:hypothetical protein